MRESIPNITEVNFVSPFSVEIHFIIATISVTNAKACNAIGDELLEGTLMRYGERRFEASMRNGIKGREGEVVVWNESDEGVVTNAALAKIEH